MFLAHLHRGFFREVADPANQQVVRLFGQPSDAEFPLSSGGNAKAAIAELVEVDDACLSADLEDIRAISTRPPGVTAGADEHRAERHVFPHTATHHIQIARFEYLQGQRTALKENGAKGE